LFQDVPPLVLYCQEAPVSNPLTSTWPLLVIWSLFELPVSLCKASVGAAATWSIVTVRPLERLLTLPATSVALAVIVCCPSASELVVIE